MIDGLYAVDFQVHSFRSHDGRASILEQCERAVAIGLNAIGFSEHKDFDPADPVVEYFDYDAYMREIETARIRFGGALDILAGVEIDYQQWFEDKIGDYLDRHAFDFVIGSVHYVTAEMVMTPEYNSTRTRETAYLDYFNAVLQSVRSGLFDVVGHLEYANRRGIGAWGPYSPDPYRDALAELFEAMREEQVCLEINTAGLHQNIGLTYPCAATVEMYAASGGTLLSLASDAHHPDQLGHAYADAAQLALRCGLSDVSLWDRRVRTAMPLRSS